jgi:NDP-sugar pyrophosphorylase family protein
MKTLLICPNQASGIAALADTRPAVTLPFLGEHIICYWMRHLAENGFKEVRIVTTDPVEQLEEYVGDGSRWGMRVELRHEVRELTAAEARKRHRSPEETDWPAEPGDVIEADHLPGMPEHKLFASYRSFFEGLALWLPNVAASKRIGLREIQPGVWVGRKTHISSSAILKGPCFIGDHVRIGKNTTIGPMSFLEDRVVVDQTCEIAHSWVAPETFVGGLTHLNKSLAWGNLLINWQMDSHTLIPDSFLLSSLSEDKRRAPQKAPARETADARVPRPFSPVISLVQKVQS